MSGNEWFLCLTETFNSTINTCKIRNDFLQMKLYIYNTHSQLITCGVPIVYNATVHNQYSKRLPAESWTIANTSKVPLRLQML
jgi:zona occludens toxin (predicted ATPase)